MGERVPSDVVLYVCHNCIPRAEVLPRQWEQEGIRVLVKQIPCSGKIDVQYLFHALEGGARGVCVIACPKGECQLAQGNYRAEVRVLTVQRLLEEIGLEPERVELLHFSQDDPPDLLVQMARDFVSRLGRLGKSPIGDGRAAERSTKVSA